MSRVCLLSLTALLACARAYPDPAGEPAGITDDANAVTLVTGELGNPVLVPCLESEDPTLFVFWYRGHGKGKLLKTDAVYGMRRNALLIRSLAIDTLGPYSCQAYNSEDMKPLQIFVVRAYMPDGTSPPDSDWLLPRDTGPPRPGPQLPSPGTQPPSPGTQPPSPGTQPTTSAETSTTTTMTTTEASKLNDEPEVTASVGGIATLRSMFNVQDESWMETITSRLKIWWDFGDIKIDSNAGRYRLLSDGALEIVSLYCNDTGVYTFTALNMFGKITQKIHLVVNDTVRMPAGIAGDENAVVTGELGSPLEVRCLAYGYPPPCVFWYNGFDEEALVLYNDRDYETRRNVLTIKSLNEDTLGEYTCGAYNGVGQVALWKVIVRTNMPEQPLVTGNGLTQPGVQPSTTVKLTTTGLLSNGPSTAGGLIETRQETTEAFESETSARSTITEGTTDVIGTTALDPCSSFEFGCCADNETEATGSEKEGCLETETSTTGALTEITNETTESIEANEGSTTSEDTTDVGTTTLEPCSSFEFGCCADNETKASGPDGQGCPCNATEFGCCPDGVSPGCGCQYALHGCCPDSVTIAQGPGNQGCGCQYTEYGCCPDRHTTASGPNNEGCACNTYQFGCCADGVTTATGPEQQGCHCRDSEFGCCADGETPATGLDGAGCDCSSSRHGCCPDGRAEATEPKFLECTDAPENKQAACSMSTDPGPCHNFTAMWYYDLGNGVCFRFWYGGCDGNGNRFSTKDECKDVCVQPSPKDACKLPSVKGACDMDYRRWHYNSTLEQCIPFRYGGCLGNANNFDTQELCQKQCEPSSITETSTARGLTETTENTTGATEVDTSTLSTTNEGTTDVIGTTTPDPCSSFEFGCCADNETEATGSEKEGCPETETSTTGALTETTNESAESIEANIEDSTTNEGTTDVIGITTPDPCSSFEFGCCADNETEATGSKKEGCPETETSTTGALTETTNESTESIEANEGSTTNEGTTDVIGITTPDPCSSFEFGCCADNETEATGSKKEGCPETETSTTGTLTETTNESTESIEVNEGSTTNQGTTGVIGITTMDPCSSFEFGCCADNETEATGPDGQGCPCNNTEFGCYPVGYSPAVGRESENCAVPCCKSLYGCCQDEKTPAHGRDFEGCCLLQAFECCPDNRRPAEGPHLEGCGCQYALHGCCPDSVTIAQGPGNQGCGCQYTEFGCCPDRHTAASGPNNEGCACNTYQFGCCADGVTIATGPEQQGCHCRDSTFKCCGDGETPATGPDGAGCDCSSSRHGCCPDGRTEATGPKFLGCTDTPENKQAACSMSTDPGPCHNFTAMWYYDLAYGGCSRFWYGGCDGNDNRFSNKEECEDVCVQPSAKDACKLRSVKGVCDADYRRWHYNSTLEQCNPFRYGGCLGNANNFATRELCQKQCEPSSLTDQCNLPFDQGSCAGNYSHWGFNSEAHRCEQFIWGGCEGNSNRFSSEAACQLRCAQHNQPLQCTLPREPGNCTAREALWSFSQSENRCVPFYYSGCGGNDNRFTSREACEQTCPSAYVLDKCTLPAEIGQCSNYRERWFYNTTFKKCLQFYYGGCGGNENNFGTEAECNNSCLEIKTTTTTTTTTTTANSDELQPAEFCFNAIDAGPCNNSETRYAYDSELGRCVTFQYGGCDGNQNNFPDEDYCSYYCQPMEDVCQLPMLQGPCDDSLMRWFYDPTTDSCSQFTYGGCEGNDNRFESLEACEYRCRTGPATAKAKARRATTLTTKVIADGPPECIVPEALEDCRYGGEVWFFDPSCHECVTHANREAGPVCRHTGTFTSQEACEQSCGAFRGVDPVRMPVGIAGEENAVVTGELGSPLEVRCLAYGYPPPSVFWYRGYNGAMVPYNNAVYFARGNILLIRSLALETLGQYTCQAYNGEGKAASWVVFVRAYQPEEYFIENELLVPRNTLPTKPSTLPPTTAESTTTTSRTTTEAPRIPLFTDICTLPMLQGPCDDSSMCWFYDFTTDSCSQFTYGGCEGNDNRFESLEACEYRCRTGHAIVASTTLKTTAVIADEPPECIVPEALEDCRYGGVVWFFDPSRHECVSLANQEAGPVCRHTGTFTSQEACEQSCGAFRGVDVPAALVALPQPKPEVLASEGGSATLRCLFHGNPPPNITWTFGELTIDGNAGHYRLMSDGALQIVSLNRNDTGIYICVADNGLGVATQKTHLIVNDPVRMPVGIAGEENAVVTGELGSPLEVRCLAYGYPPPSVFWYRGYNGAMVPFNNAVYFARGNILLIRSLALETLGQYTCQAYNGEGKAASWVVFVRAYQPEEYFIENELLVPRNTLPTKPSTLPPTTAETSTTTSRTTTEAPRIPLFTVPVSTHVSTPYSTLNSGTDLRLTCDVDGFPEPDVYWTKDGATIQADGRITITGKSIVSRLTVARVSDADSGLYTCHARNQYSSQSDTAQINVQQIVVPAKCTDSPFFADCNLIVRSKFCRHDYYSKFCCKSCVEAGQLDPQDVELQADQPYRKKLISATLS